MEDAADSTKTKNKSYVEPQTKNKQINPKRLFIALLIVILLFATHSGMLLLGKNYSKKLAAQQSETIANLEDIVKKQAEEIAKLKNKQKSAPTPSDTTSSSLPDEATLSTIEAAINTRNTAALRSYMAENITVILAASGGVGERTAAQAIGDLAYLNDATTPWSFDLPAATLETWRSGIYARYLSEDSFIGKSANNYVVSFTFNSESKISGIFMTGDAALLN